MSYRKHGLKALGLCLMAALSLMAFAATGAQALGGEWKILGVKAAAAESVQVVANSSQLLEVPAVKVVIHCSGLTLDNGSISNQAAPTGAHGTGTLLYTGCVTLLSEATSTVCKVGPGKNGTITAKALLHLVLHPVQVPVNTNTFILVQPEAGLSGKFVDILFEDPECSLTPSKAVTGQIVAECVPVTSCKTEAATHTIKNTAAGLFPEDKLKFGASEAFYKGEGTLELSGVADKGKNWSGHAP